MKVMTFGTFDILHPGHVYLLKKAKQLGDILIIVLARDNNIFMFKGKKPDNNIKVRLKNLKKLNIANRVIFGDKEDYLKCIKIEKPDIIALGYDQNINVEILRKYIKQYKKNIKIIRLKSYFPNKYKSSLIKKNK